jgi:hypothetical protein
MPLAGAALVSAAVQLGAGGTAQAQYIVPQAPPSYGTANLIPNQRIMLQGVAGGGVSLSAVDGSCRGYAQPTPSHVLMVPPGAAMVRIGATSGIDTTLMVQMPDGRIVCDDDGGDGLNPLLEVPAVPGQMRVWVGSYSSSNAGPYQLDASAFGGGAPVVVAPPPGAGALFGTADVRMGGRPDPLVVTGNFGGPIQASNMSPDCRGWISGPPSHIVNARTGFPNLRFVVRASSDTTLVVRYPDGRIVCNDDGGGSLNPLVEGPTGPGQIMVWVGSYGSGGSGPYVMGITTIPGIGPDQIGTGVGPGPVVVTPPPPVVVTPPPPSMPTVTARVELMPRIPVTLIGPGMAPGTVAVWSPRGGPSMEVGIMQVGGGYRIYANIGGAPQTVVDVPASVAQDAVVTVTQRPDQRLLVRAERAPTGSDAGQQMLMLVQLLNGAPTIAEQWVGTFSDRAPRWSR